MQPNAQEPSKVRRRIVQGSLAAPVVLTVSSASAASVSSFGRCLANLKGQRTSALFLTDIEAQTDTWFRDKVMVSQLKWGNTIDWFYLNPTDNLYYKLTDLTYKVSPLDKNWQLQQTNWRWMLVWVDSQTGNRWRMTIQQPTGYQATTKSCYTSMVVG